MPRRRRRALAGTALRRCLSLTAAIAAVVAATAPAPAAAIPPASPATAPTAAAAAPPAASATAPAPAPTGPPPFPAPLGTALAWRLAGPFRGGRVLAVCGVPGGSETFYFGAVGGGVWRSDDAGNVWRPIFDGPPSGSIGAIAVAPSNPDVLYVGTGEADMRSDISYGDGIYRSTDGGRTFEHRGLADSRQIARILIDPANPDMALVAALGHGFGPNPERGVFRTEDGGKTWQRTLYRDERTGAIDLAADPDDPRTVYAALWEVRREPWSVYAPTGGPGGGLFKSVDGGRTWRELTGAAPGGAAHARGLPEGPFGRIGLAVAGGRPGTRGRRLYALIDAPHAAGLYRSDDAGATWSRTADDPRITSRPWYFGEVTADPADPDRVYVANVSLYGSTDGGRTFAALRGAPGGDDYHALWIDPADSRRRILGIDQGAQVTVDGGATWSTWFNQPTAQIYHVATDDRFPYTLYGAQQDSGTVATASRGDAGQITWRDWFSTGTGESGYILPDPDDPDTVYGGDTSGHLFRFTRATGKIQDVSPVFGVAGDTRSYRYPWTAALAISPFPPHALFQGSQYVHRSTDHGATWAIVSPDLTAAPAAAAAAAAPAAAGVAGTVAVSSAADGKAVITTIAPSAARRGLVWAGTDNGRIHLSVDDGATWREVSPPGLAPWTLVSLVEPSRHDPAAAYAALDRHQMDDLRPLILRTRDLGRTWTPIAAGIPDGAYVHVVREDPERRGLLYAGTETGVYVSFDDGGRWQPLQANLPAASVRDLAVHGDDLVAATHGRSFWILDGLAPLRQLDPAVVAAPGHLFTPAVAYRLHRGENNESPLPPETPAGTNPPAGAIVDYWLAGEPAGAVTLDIFDAHGDLVRRLSSADPPPARPAAADLTFPAFWLVPGAPLGKHAGLNRFIWNLAYPEPKVLDPQGSADAVYGQDTPFDPRGPLVLPGTYQLRLTAGGRTYTAPLVVAADPRQQAPPAALAAQLALVRGLDAALDATYETIRRLQALAAKLDGATAVTASSPAPAATSPAATAALRAGVAKALGPAPDDVTDETAPAGLLVTHQHLTALAISAAQGDAAPTAPLAAAAASWRSLAERQLAAAADLLAAPLAGR